MALPGLEWVAAELTKVFHSWSLRLSSALRRRPSTDRIPWLSDKYRDSQSNSHFCSTITYARWPPSLDSVCLWPHASVVSSQAPPRPEYRWSWFLPTRFPEAPFLLRAVTYHDPVWTYDWKAVFRERWIP